MNCPKRFRAIPALSLAALVAGCAQPPKPLYLWESFPRQQYEALLRDGMSTESQVQAMEEHAVKARSANAALPPGFRAHLGMLYLAGGNADKARELWAAEVSAFPEAAPYMNQLLKRLDEKPKATAMNQGNPA